VFQDKIWILGGWEKNKWGLVNDVWASSDGEYWQEIASSVQWTARKGHSAVVFQDKIWVIAGVDSRGAKNDVWNSSDGKNWELVTNKAPWPIMYDQAVMREKSMVFFRRQELEIRNKNPWMAWKAWALRAGI
jgi:hypothetical protein